MKLKYFIIYFLSIFLCFSAVSQELRLSKTGIDQITDSNTQTRAGREIKWVIGVGDDIAPTGKIRIQDNIPAGQTFVPGSLEVPPNFTPLYSIDGANFTLTEQTGVTIVGAEGANFTTPVTGMNNTFLPVLSIALDTKSPTGGDGYVPIPYTHSDGSLLLYNVYHHTNDPASNYGIFCYNVSKNEICDLNNDTAPDFPKYNSDTAGDDGLSNANAHLITPSTVLTKIHNNQLFFPAQRAAPYNDMGLGCLNLETGLFCDFISIAPNNKLLTGGYTLASFYGAYSVGTEVYMHDHQYNLYCYDVDLKTSCGTYNLGVPAYDGTTDFITTTEVAEDKIYILAIYFTQMTPQNILVKCFDSTTKAECANFSEYEIPGTSIFPPSGPTGFLFQHQDTFGNIDALCGLFNGNLTCFDSQANTFSDPVLENTLLNDIPWIAPLTNGGDFDYRIGSKVYLPMRHVLTDEGATYCYDFATQSACSNFGNPGTPGYKTWPTVNAGVTGEYGYAEVNGCLYGLGNPGIMWSFDPATGTTPCSISNMELTVRKSDYYCDGLSHTVELNLLQVSGVDSNIALLEVDVVNADTDTVIASSGDISGSGQYDLSGIDFDANPDLIFKLKVVYIDPAMIPESGYPVSFTFSGDDPQICFISKLDENFTGSVADNVVTETESGISSKGELEVLAPFMCDNESIDGIHLSVDGQSAELIRAARRSARLRRSLAGVSCNAFSSAKRKKAFQYFEQQYLNIWTAIWSVPTMHYPCDDYEENYCSAFDTFATVAEINTYLDATKSRVKTLLKSCPRNDPSVRRIKQKVRQKVSAIKVRLAELPGMIRECPLS